MPYTFFLFFFLRRRRNFQRDQKNTSFLSLSRVRDIFRSTRVRYGSCRNVFCASREFASCPRCTTRPPITDVPSKRHFASNCVTANFFFRFPAVHSGPCTRNFANARPEASRYAIPGRDAIFLTKNRAFPTHGGETERNARVQRPVRRRDRGTRKRKNTSRTRFRRNGRDPVGRTRSYPIVCAALSWILESDESKCAFSTAVRSVPVTFDFPTTTRIRQRVTSAFSE